MACRSIPRFLCNWECKGKFTVLLPQVMFAQYLWALASAAIKSVVHLVICMPQLGNALVICHAPLQKCQFE
jgi:hypothetical protein